MELLKFLGRNILDTLLLIILILIISIILFKIMNTNGKLTNRSFEIESSKINDAINIVQISDMHDATFGENNIELVTRIKEQLPDLVVATGDKFDADRTNITKTYNMFNTLCSEVECPVVYIPGNHETSRPDSYKKLKTMLEDTRVICLENEEYTIKINDTDINLICFDNKLKYDVKKLSDMIDISNNDKDNFNLVLCHYPENFKALLDVGVPFDIDLILSGHAHGGQARFFGKGLYAPNQGYLPKYTDGLYNITDSTKLIVNRGLGNSGFPFRINNNPDIITVILK